MTTPEPGNIPSAETSLRRLTEDVEKAFLSVRHTLTNDDTATIYLRTLDLVDGILEESLATGLITGEQRSKLAEALGWMRQVPRLV